MESVMGGVKKKCPLFHVSYGSGFELITGISWVWFVSTR
jgi:hypothetical protein